MVFSALASVACSRLQLDMSDFVAYVQVAKILYYYKIHVHFLYNITRNATVLGEQRYLG